MNIVFELPFYSPSVGGIVESIKFAEKLGASVRFQRKSGFHPILNVPFTLGMPDSTFPKCDIVVTYSDNPYLDKLVKLPQIGKVFVYMLSYGMSYANERHNALHPKVTTLCSTKKIEQAIIKDGGLVTRIGFALDMDDMFDEGKERFDNSALYYHPMASKRYPLAVEISNALYGQKLIDNVYTFGTHDGYESHKKPAGLIKHYFNANREQIRHLFNQSRVFISTSNSEGLNLTPVEATLCGCPAVICDGAIGELFIDGHTCYIAKEGDYFDVLNCAIELLSDFDLYRELFRDNMRKIVKQYTWDNLLNNFKKVIE